MDGMSTKHQHAVVNRTQGQQIFIKQWERRRGGSYFAADMATVLARKTMSAVSVFVFPLLKRTWLTPKQYSTD